MEHSHVRIFRTPNPADKGRVYSRPVDPAFRDESGEQYPAGEGQGHANQPSRPSHRTADFRKELGRTALAVEPQTNAQTRTENGHIRRISRHQVARTAPACDQCKYAVI